MRVNIIEPTVKIREKKKRVCAYARVSTESDKQGESLENQSIHYEKFICANPEFEYAGVFADQGISGTTENRPEFQRMLELARQGQIDVILTKSISRFARNTTIMLEVVRELKDIGVEVRFEKENISTLSGDGELMLTVLSSFAQEESKNISDNIKWRIRSDFQKGKIMLNTARFLGYDKDKTGNIVINEAEAVIVRRIFELYNNSVGCLEIARTLTSEGHITVSGHKKWSSSVISNMLRNEKYKGDVLCQKTYTPTHLSGGTVENRGQVEQYYITDHHEAIVSKETWDRAQEVRKENRRNKGVTNGSKYTNRYPYTGILFCSKCGATLKRRVWNSKNASKKYVWQCSNYISNGVNSCPGTKVDEVELNKLKIEDETIVKEEIRDGKKYHSYTNKGKQNKPCGIIRANEEKNGGILPSINGTGRTIIKL